MVTPGRHLGIGTPRYRAANQTHSAQPPGDYDSICRNGMGGCYRYQPLGEVSRTRRADIADQRRLGVHRGHTLLCLAAPALPSRHLARVRISWKQPAFLCDPVLCHSAGQVAEYPRAPNTVLHPTCPSRSLRSRSGQAGEHPRWAAIIRQIQQCH